MALSPFMSLLLPTVSSTPGPTYATEMNAAVSANGGDIDSHDHSPGHGALIPVAGLTINAPLAMGGLSITQAAALTFQPQTLPATPNTLAFDVNGNLNVFDASGTDILMTLSGAVNTTTATNGISGNGYGSPVLVSWVSGGKNYTLIQAASTYADLFTGPVQLFDSTLAATTDSVGLLSPPGLAASYTLTFPGALPGSTGLVTVDSTGLLAFSGTLVSSTAKAFLVVNASGVPSVFPSVAPSPVLNFLNINNVGTISDLLIADGSTVSMVSTVHITPAGIGFPQQSAANGQISTLSSQGFITSATSFVDVVSPFSGVALTATVVTSNSLTARPVRVSFQPDGSGTAAELFAAQHLYTYQILRNGVSIAVFVGGSTTGSTNLSQSPSAITFIDTGAPANTSCVYKLQVKTTAGGVASAQYSQITAIEQ